MPARRRFTHNTIAVVYDFDGTLSPQPMQEYTVLPKLGVPARRFWNEVDREIRKTKAEAMLVYMRLLLEKAELKRVHIGRSDFAAMAKSIKYFPGVESWFGRVNDFVRKESDGAVNIQHYIISSGIREILDGIAIRRHFRRIYASEYHYDHHGVAVFPKVLITDTTKTQYLFRINKGRLEQTESINEHMPEHLRPIPFSNIIYIGDGVTDVPGMAVTRLNGGNAVAVYRPGSAHDIRVCRELLAANRVNFIAPADYRPGRTLERRVRRLLRSVIAQIDYRRELFECRRGYGLEK
jgi:2-hydroxy-3-keto-5-methylthiopentenyl-1-phosphate phosphatase